MAKGGFPGGFGGGNMNNLMKQAQKMQKQMEDMQKELETKEFEASAGGGAILVKINGKKELTAVNIKPEVVDADDVEMLEDLIMSAVNEALRKVLGTHVIQQGSYVGCDILRFDFNNFSSLTNEEILKVESIVNEQISKAQDVITKEMELNEAKKLGVQAVLLYNERNIATLQTIAITHNKNDNELFLYLMISVSISFFSTFSKLFINLHLTKINFRHFSLI